MLNIFKGITIPAKAVEGAISISQTVSVTGDGPEPSVAAPVKQGDAVAIIGDDGKYPYIAKATGSNGVVIGFCHDHPEYDSEAITAGLYVEWSADGWKKTASSGTTKSDAICLIGQTSDDEIVIGLK